MTWGQAQAGNRASKTRPYLQWWVNKSEQDVRSSALQNLHHSARFFCRSPHHRGPPTNPAARGSCMPYTQLVCVCFNRAWLRVILGGLNNCFRLPFPNPMPATLLKHLAPLGRCQRVASELSISPTAIPCRMHRISSDLRS